MRACQGEAADLGWRPGYQIRFREQLVALVPYQMGILPLISDVTCLQRDIASLEDPKTNYFHFLTGVCSYRLVA